MRGSFARRIPVVLAAVAAVALVGSVALAAIPTSGGTVYACYSKTTGALRVINYPAVRCTSSEKILTLASGTKIATQHVDGTVKVYEPKLDREWLARFEVRTTSGRVEFGYLELYGLTAAGPGPNLGQIHVFHVTSVDYYRTPTGAQGARLHQEECSMIPPTPCFDSPYEVSDGATVGQPDTFLANLRWYVESGNISIYTTGG